ncbi:hypothetical protein FRB99_008482 [Tulasnella sp. 403]|nr:hypothetical protein FRB99_008482 [Tulasnella sp. 403]
MSITHITSQAQLEKLLSSAGSKLTTFMQPGKCGPCHAIAPKFEAFAKEFTGVQFLKCDVDACSEVAQKYSVTAMPTFVFIKNSSKVDQVRGADPRSLENTIRKHAGSGSGAFSGQGQTLGGGPSSSGTAPAPGNQPNAAGVDPQLALLAGLFGLYLLYLYFK